MRTMAAALVVALVSSLVISLGIYFGLREIALGMEHLSGQITVSQGIGFGTWDVNVTQ